MREVPSLISLCIHSLKKELIHGINLFLLLLLIHYHALISFVFIYLFILVWFCCLCCFKLSGDDLVPVVFELPHELFDTLVLSLPPLALQNVQTQTYVHSILLLSHQHFFFFFNYYVVITVVGFGFLFLGFSFEQSKNRIYQKWEKKFFFSLHLNSVLFFFLTVGFGIFCEH